MIFLLKQDFSLTSTWCCSKKKKKKKKTSKQTKSTTVFLIVCSTRVQVRNLEWLWSCSVILHCQLMSQNFSGALAEAVRFLFWYNFSSQIINNFPGSSISIFKTQHCLFCYRVCIMLCLAFRFKERCRWQYLLTVKQSVSVMPNLASVVKQSACSAAG